MMRKTLFVSLLTACALSLSAVSASANIFGRKHASDCSNWYAGEFLDVGQVIKISKLGEIPDGLEAMGIAVDGGKQFHGKLIFGIVDDEDRHRRGKVTIGYFQTGEGRQHSFVVSRLELVKLAIENGNSFTVLSGQVEEKNGIVGRTTNIAPVFCKKVANEKFLVPLDKFARLEIIDEPEDDAAPFDGMAENKNGLGDLFETAKPKVPLGRDIAIFLGAESAISEVLLDEPKGGGLSSIAESVETKKPVNSLASLAESVEEKPLVEAVTEASITAVDDGNRLCHLAADQTYDVPWLEQASDYQLVGALKAVDSIGPYWMLPSLSRDINTLDQEVSVKATPDNTLDRLSLPLGLAKQTTLGGIDIIPLKLVDPQRVDVTTPTMVEQPDTNGLHLAVFGDPHMISISGLDEFEQRITNRYGRVPLTVDWYSVDGNGVVADPQEFDSFDALYTALPNQENPVYLSSTAKISEFLDGFQASIINNPDPIDMVFWVTEGHRLPHATPALMSKTLVSSMTKGNLRKDDLGRLKPWLYVLAGSNAFVYSPHYLKGPMIDNKPVSYYLEEGERAGDRRQILTDFERPINRFERILAEENDGRVLDAPEAEELDTEALTFDLNTVIDRMGLVVSRGAVERWSDSMSLFKDILVAINLGADPADVARPKNAISIPALMLIETDELGAPRNILAPTSTIARQFKKPTMNFASEKFRSSVVNLLQVSSKLGPDAELNAECSHFYIPGRMLGWQWDAP